MENIVIKIEKLPHCKSLPEYQTDGSAGVDLRAAIDTPVELLPMERKLFPTGLKMELPIGFEAQIRPRSGLAIRMGITVINSPGTIDSDYRGEIKIGLINLSTEPYIVEPDERIAQMIISEVKKVQFLPVLQVSETDRGPMGFGSTGKD